MSEAFRTTGVGDDAPDYVDEATAIVMRNFDEITRDIIVQKVVDYVVLHKGVTLEVVKYIGGLAQTCKSQTYCISSRLIKLKTGDKFNKKTIGNVLSSLYKMEALEIANVYRGGRHRVYRFDKALWQPIYEKVGNLSDG